MSTRDSTVKPVEDGMHTITPHLVCAGAADAIAFYERAFGAVEVMRLPAPGGKLAHAEVRIGDSILMLMDEFPDWDASGPAALGGTSVTLHLSLPDVDSAFERAVAAGAIARMAPADMFWGDRYGVVEDPFGHRWSMATHIRDVSPEEMAAAMQQGSH
ncbi:VOC family protein [Massilia sp. BSC265]|uniref:VOC family protein n=1 Tax=Massilia sp. BSC265 TaxID=1549812 RepID=UPI0004E913A4|nr:VOC family protein [Massilia sp. BSC265]KFI06596.1 glyoxalase [Massilia sp. BSC265]